ncbi:hypothetical protein [Intestinirhabdus alba]|jgi:hypothetical protein|uniref:Lipoprotein n=1 Tax=Intestinirhabdus alba TaxID=2899544 RepID=A0A6L6IPU8_9ENTR|nr:hypothetical protein [Intestinirhabdus alba]MTH46813.1 hypothetical protein [Intestinirhabdus alba]
MFKTIASVFLKAILLYSLIFTSAGCEIKKDKQLTLPVNSTALLSYYKNKINSGESELTLPEKYKNQTKNFNQQEIKIPVQGENFGSQYTGSNVRYYELGQFNCENNACKLIIYNKTGEADTPLLNAQLSIYDATGNLLDALLLSSYFQYEDMVRFSDFVIHPDYTIDIDNYVKYIYKDGEYGEPDSLIKHPVSQIYLKEKYKIENGQFKLLSRIEKETQ